jgi:hypothetical protein
VLVLCPFRPRGIGGAPAFGVVASVQMTWPREMLTRLKAIKILLHRRIAGLECGIEDLLKSLIQTMAACDSACFGLGLGSATIMNVLIVLIVTRHPVQLTIVSNIRKCGLY